MAIANRQAAFSHESSGSDEMSERQEREMKNQTQTTGAARFILQTRSKLLVGLRVVPVAAMLFGIATMAPAASATSCYKPSNIAVNGGRVSNETTLDLSADGGVAVSTADGGDGNAAAGGSGGANGNGGNAAAGNAGVAVAAANGGIIDLDDINSGNNRGNTIVVSTGSYPCSYGPSNVSVNGGTVSNETTLRLSADGGTAVSSANGGNGNAAAGGPGGLLGNGGNASAGLGGVAVAQANGGAISVGDINSGNNRGNTILVGSGGLFGRASNVHINGGTVSNSTTIDISADGGTAVSSADGGNGNAAAGGPGGANGNGGDAAAGNGGVAVAEANGGAVTIGDINSGGNSGNTIVVEGVQGGNVAVSGGTVTNETTIDISADGGLAVSNANGGDGNIAVAGSGGIVGNGGDAAAGNGGVAVSEANGGTIDIGDVNSGYNSGNTIVVGN
jgi:hypothetical protein